MSPARRTGAVHVLLVDDNPGDVDLVLDALRRPDSNHRISVAVDGVDALHQLRLPGELPDVVILDLNLPRKDGRTVLKEMKADPRLRHIPVVILSSSEADRDLADAYALQASCFVTKPPDLDDFFAAMRDIEQFWLRLVKFAPSTEPRAVGS